jgi:hypothetical protein
VPTFGSINNNWSANKMSETKNTFEELAKVNVNPHIDKKGGLSYLSWAWAVDYMTRLDPNAEWEYREWDGKPFLTLPDGSCMVYCTVTFGGKKKTCHLPVMDHRNKAILNPDAFQVNTAMQRALVKAIALHGLGLYIYAGEDLPKDEADAKAAEPKPMTAESIAKANISPTAGLREQLKPERLKAVEAVASEVIDCFEVGEQETAYDIIEEAKFDTDEKAALWTYFSSGMRSALKKIHKARTEKAEPPRDPALHRRDHASVE